MGKSQAQAVKLALHTAYGFFLAELERRARELVAAVGWLESAAKRVRAQMAHHEQRDKQKRAKGPR